MRTAARSSLLPALPRAAQLLTTIDAAITAAMPRPPLLQAAPPTSSCPRLPLQTTASRLPSLVTSGDVVSAVGKWSTEMTSALSPPPAVAPSAAPLCCQAVHDTMKTRARSLRREENQHEGRRGVCTFLARRSSLEGLKTFRTVASHPAPVPAPPGFLPIYVEYTNLRTLASFC